MLSSDDLNIFIMGHNYMKWPPVCAEELRTSTVFLSKHVAAPNKTGFCLERKKGNVYLQKNINGQCIPTASQNCGVAGQTSSL